jgi:hypothetical protein
LTGRIVTNFDTQQGRKPTQEDLAYVRIASHVTTHEPGNLAAASHAGERQSLRKDTLEFLGVVDRGHRRAVAHDVRVAVREDHNVASAQVNGRAIHQAGIGAPFGEQMKHDDVPGAGGDIRSHG